MLRAEGIASNLVNVYVADEEERCQYEAALDPAMYGRLIVGVVGIVAQREFIVQQWEKGQHLVLLDDDVGSVDLSLHPVQDLDAFFRMAFAECERVGSYMWGVYPTYNPYFRQGRPLVSYGLNYIIAAFHGIINRPGLASLPLRVSVSNPCKEDVERTLLYFQQDGVLVRFNRVGFRTRYYGVSGGLGTFQERVGPSQEACRALLEAYLGWGKVRTRKNGMTEFRLSRIKFVDEPIPQTLVGVEP